VSASLDLKFLKKYSAANGWGLVWMQRLGSDSIASATINLHDGTQLFLKIEQGRLTVNAFFGVRLNAC